jgi:predicted transcriptional regulator
VSTVTIGISSAEETKARTLRAFASERQGAFISFPTVELLWKVVTAKRWELLHLLAGAGPLSIREISRRGDRDVKSVHGDVQALLRAGVLDRDEGGRIVFPYDEIHVDFRVAHHRTPFATSLPDESLVNPADNFIEDIEISHKLSELSLKENAVMNFSSYPELAKAVDQNDGVMVAEMGKLRDIHGAGKLGSVVVSAIHEQLESHGLGHAPGELPTFQHELAIIYRKATPVGRVIEAITNINGRSDAVLKDAVGGNSEFILQKIKELVSD